MKLRYILMAVLFAFMIICSPAGALADNSAGQAALYQNTPEVSRDSQTVGEEKTAKAAPELNIPEKNYQFENVPAGQTVTHDFIVHNKGTAPLHITRVKTG